MYTKDYISYFKYLTAQHTLFQHADTEGSRVFAVISQEQAAGDFRTGADTEGWLFRLVVPQWVLSENGHGGGFYTKDWLGGFIIAKRFSAREEGDEAQMLCLDDCDQQGEIFAGRIIQDCENGHPLFNFSVRSPIQLQFRALPKMQITDGYIGRLFTFRYQNSAVNCGKNTTSWLDDGLTPFVL